MRIPPKSNQNINIGALFYFFPLCLYMVLLKQVLGKVGIIQQKCMGIWTGVLKVILDQQDPFHLNLPQPHNENFRF